jgi:hypothetical protein
MAAGVHGDVPGEICVLSRFLHEVASNRLDSRIDELTRMLEPKRLPTYEVKLVWIEPEGSPHVPEPGTIVLDFGKSPVVIAC